ncbi:MAG TPA: FAD-dependent oxidoreductase [Jatrophihabitantaceae bacterium]
MRSSLADAAPEPFWLDSPLRPTAEPPLVADTSCDLAVVGGGYTGLWTALLAKEAEPSRDVLLVEGRRIGWAASGRNGGFCAASLTHGIANGTDRFPDEMPTLDRLGRENLDAIEATVKQYGIDCGFERTGELDVAVEPHQVDWLHEDVEAARMLGHDCVWLDRDAVRAEVDSPTYLAGAWHRDRTALVDPARLAWGLRGACLRLGVRIAENTEVSAVDKDGAGRGCAVTPAARSARAGWHSARTHSPRCCGGCVRSPCPCTTTRW